MFLESWSFQDTTNWTSDLGYAPISFSNLEYSLFGDGTSLVIDTTNAAWLNYNLVEVDNTTNLVIGGPGSICLWVAPNWASTNAGGTGPGVWGRFIEAGTYTTNASVGWWSLYLDAGGNNIYFSAQTNNGNQATYLSAPISWTTQTWHHVALTYSATNSALDIDGIPAASGTGVTYWPGSDVLTNGFFIGSDSGGIDQIHASMDDVTTYGYVLDSGTISAMALGGQLFYLWNTYNPESWVSAQFSPQPLPILEGVSAVIQPSGTVTNCVTSATNTVWLTNLSASVISSTNTSFTFSVAGGADGVAYDLFANAALATNSPVYQWVWLGQVYHCYTYNVTNGFTAFFRLGTPMDSDFDGLTDAAELALHSNPYAPSTSGDGISDLYKYLHGLPLNSVVATPSLSQISIPSCPIQ
jgi:hypothetical protein